MPVVDRLEALYRCKTLFFGDPARQGRDAVALYTEQKVIMS